MPSVLAKMLPLLMTVALPAAVALTPTELAARDALMLPLTVTVTSLVKDLPKIPVAGMLEGVTPGNIVIVLPESVVMLTTPLTWVAIPAPVATIAPPV